MDGPVYRRRPGSKIFECNHCGKEVYNENTNTVNDPNWCGISGTVCYFEWRCDDCIDNEWVEELPHSCGGTVREWLERLSKLPRDMSLVVIDSMGDYRVLQAYDATIERAYDLFGNRHPQCDDEEDMSTYNDTPCLVVNKE